MNFKNKRALPMSITLLTLLVSLMPAAGRGSDPERQFTLSGAVITALENNHELKAQKSSLAAKEADIGIAKSFLLPKISLEERYLRTANPGYAFMTRLNQERIEASDFAPASLNNPAAVNDFQASISFEQPLYLRKASIGLVMSKMEAEASGEDLRRKREDITFRVVQCYLAVGTAVEYVGVAEKALEDAQEHRRITEVRYNSGLGLYSDTLRAATAVTEAEQRLVSARKGASVAKNALGLVMGFSGAVAISEAPPALPLKDRQYYRDQALARKDLKALALRRENAQKNVTLAEASYFPFVGIGGAYQLNDHTSPLGNEGDSWQLTAFLRWEAFDGMKRDRERTKALHQATEVEEYLEDMKKRILFTIEEAVLTLEETKKNRELAQEGVKSAEEGRRLVKVRYEGFLAPLVDLLDAQMSFDHARANLLARENDYRLAAARLAYESGTILGDLAIE